MILSTIVMCMITIQSVMPMNTNEKLKVCFKMNKFLREEMAIEYAVDDEHGQRDQSKAEKIMNKLKPPLTLNNYVQPDHGGDRHFKSCHWCHQPISMAGLVCKTCIKEKRDEWKNKYAEI